MKINNKIKEIEKEYIKPFVHPLHENYIEVKFVRKAIKKILKQFQKEIKEIQGDINKDFPCCMKERKCEETNLDGSKKQIICSNCSFRFKVNKIIKNKFGDEDGNK